MTYAEKIVVCTDALRAGEALHQLVEMGGSIDYVGGKFRVCAAVPELVECGLSSWYRAVPVQLTNGDSVRELVRAIGEVHAAWVAQREKGSETK